MVNKVILIGRIGQDVEVKEIGERIVSNFSLATTENWKDKQGEWKEATEWHNCAAWRDLKWLNKGDQVYVEGSINTRKVGEGDSVKYFTSIRIRDIRRLQKSPNAVAAPAPTSTGKSKEEEDDLPF